MLGPDYFVIDCGLVSEFIKMDVQRGSDMKRIDSGIKNRFQWKWLENKNNSGTFLSDYFRKIEIAGKVRCLVCNQTIMYGSSGLKALIKHGNSTAHETASKIKKGNQTLPAVFRFAKAVQSGEAGRPVLLVPGNEQGPIPSSGSNVRNCSLPYGAPPNVHESATCSGKRDAFPMSAMKTVRPMLKLWLYHSLLKITYHLQ